VGSTGHEVERTTGRGARSAFKNILIIKPSSLGDIVDALPAVGAIRRKFKTARISWLVKEEWAPILHAHPYIDHVIAAPFRWGALPHLARAMREPAFDLVVDLQGLLRSAVLGRATGAGVRVGFAAAREGAPWFYTDRVTEAPGVTHAVERYLAIARFLGGEGKGDDFGIVSSPATRERVARFLNESGVKGDAPFAVFHATARWQNKRWPQKRFAALARALTARGRPVVFIGSASEREELARWMSEVAPPAINAAGRFTLPETAALLRRAAFCVCNDSGPMHLAAAVGTRVIALFGPTDPRKVGPYGPGHVVIQKHGDCAGCGRHACVRDNACMRAIEVDDVLGQITI